MFKKIKENEKVSKFRQLWADKRFRSIIFLAFWLIFAILIVAAYRPVYNSNVKSYQEKKTDEVSSVLMKNYNFTLVDTKNDKINVITGKTYNDFKTFTINNVEYYYNGKIYKMTTPATEDLTFKLGYLNITPKLINSMIERATLLETNIYSISLTDFITLYDANELAKYTASTLKDKDVKITVAKENGLFYKVDMDITEYIKLTDQTVNSDVLTFNYTNVNETEDFTKEYESRLLK